jgi:hypothetical protein
MLAVSEAFRRGTNRAAIRQQMIGAEDSEIFRL